MIMCLGAGYAIAAYQAFSAFFIQPFASSSALMLTSFLVGVPVAAGMLVGFIGSRSRVAGMAGSSALSMLAIGLYVFAAGAFLREGMICIVMATPLFLVLAFVGAVIGHWTDSRGGTGGPKLLSVAMVLPYVLAPIEGQLPPSPVTQVVTSSIYVEASPPVIWHHINFPLDIQPTEMRGSFSYLIGVPYPLDARTLEPRVGGRRELRWERGIRFKEKITAYEPGVHIAWTYEFGPDSFPPGSLDDHIVIGGRYFNLDSTSYSLSPEGTGTRLSIEVKTRVDTTFNWYADPWARYLVRDTAETILRFYKARSEHRERHPVAG